MQQSLPAGLFLTLLAGLMAGVCMLPLKLLRKWKFENAWFIFSLVSLVILPWTLAVAIVRNLPETYLALSWQQLAIPMLLGSGWGVAQILFGISIERLGLGIAYAIIVGLGAVFGTLVPLFVQQQTPITHHSLNFIIMGIALMVLGILLTTWGGQIRERVQLPALLSSSRSTARGYTAAILLAILCGVLAPMLNYSFAFGQGIGQKAAQFGNSPTRAAYAIWPIALAGGFLPNVAYSTYLLFRNETWQTFIGEAADLYKSCLMGALWMGAFAVYGVSTIYLGKLGTSTGWGLLQIFMIMTAVLSGILTGEWKDAPRAACTTLVAGLGGLTGAIVSLACGSR